MADAPRAFRFSYDVFYDFYTSRTNDASLFDDADGAVAAYLYDAECRSNGIAQDFRVSNVAAVRRVRCDPMNHAHGVYLVCFEDTRYCRRLWFVYPEPCENRATGQAEPYLVANHLSFSYDDSVAAKRIRMYTATYFINENEDADVVHVHDPFDDGACAIVQKNRARRALIVDVLWRPFATEQRMRRAISGGGGSPIVVASAQTEFTAACDRAFGGSLERVVAIGVRQPEQADGDWVYSVEIQWRREHWPEDLKVPTYIVRVGTSGSIAFERAFAKALNEGPTRAERLLTHRHTSR